MRGERLKQKKKSSVSVAKFGTVGVANVVLTRQQLSGDCGGWGTPICGLQNQIVFLTG